MCLCACGADLPFEALNQSKQLAHVRLAVDFQASIFEAGNQFERYDESAVDQFSKNYQQIFVAQSFA